MDIKDLYHSYTYENERLKSSTRILIACLEDTTGKDHLTLKECSTAIQRLKASLELIEMSMHDLERRRDMLILKMKDIETI